MNNDDYIDCLRNNLEREISDLNRQIEESIDGGRCSFCPECGMLIPAGSSFCPGCGTCIVVQEQNNKFGNSTETQPIKSNEQCSCGILFTDSEALSNKYDRSAHDITTVLQVVIERSARHGISWMLLDAADYSTKLGKDAFWLDYNQLISDFMEVNRFQYGMKTPVFIIGGDDVIPIPLIEDTFGTSDDGRVPCDMCYCFTGNFFSDLWDGDHTIRECDVRNTVSRLPFEDTIIDSTIENDILGYFERCEEYYKDGIPADFVMMTTNASWLPASRTMSEHLPLIEYSLDDDLVDSGMFVSPPVSSDNEMSRRSVELTLESANMLLFNLHGSSMLGRSGFYSDTGEAFNTQMLGKTNARVLNTVACYGARYHGYLRDDSMMLSAIHKNGFLLYAGSLIPVPMMELSVPKGVEVHAGSGSEHLMPIFCVEQYSGLYSGEAMMKAKLEYFNTFRHLESDDFSLATMQMFSLYGNPMLRIKRDEGVLYAAQSENVLPVLPGIKRIEPLRVKRLSRINFNEKASFLHSSIAKELYDHLGLEPKRIDHIDYYSIPNSDGSENKGFMYAYVEEKQFYASRTWVEVNEEGKVKRVIKTK